MNHHRSILWLEFSSVDGCELGLLHISPYSTPASKNPLDLQCAVHFSIVIESSANEDPLRALSPRGSATHPLYDHPEGAVVDAMGTVEVDVILGVVEFGSEAAGV